MCVLTRESRDPIISEASFSEYSIFPVHAIFPMSAIVKTSLKDRVDRKASMPIYQNVETIAAIPRVSWVL